MHDNIFQLLVYHLLEMVVFASRFAMPGMVQISGSLCAALRRFLKEGEGPSFYGVDDITRSSDRTVRDYCGSSRVGLVREGILRLLERCAASCYGNLMT